MFYSHLKMAFWNSLKSQDVMMSWRITLQILITDNIGRKNIDNQKWKCLLIYFYLFTYLFISGCEHFTFRAFSSAFLKNFSRSGAQSYFKKDFANSLAKSLLWVTANDTLFEFCLAKKHKVLSKTHIHSMLQCVYRCLIYFERNDIYI